MRTSFVHVGDMRLGGHYPAHSESFERTAERFRFTVEFALEQRASFVLFVGNLFDGPNVDAAGFQVAWRGLLRLREKGIQAVAIRGSRDAETRVRNGTQGSLPPGSYPNLLSWHELLAQENLLTILDADLENGQLRLSARDRRTGCAGFLDFSRARLFGLRYGGFMTGRLLQELAQSIAQLDNRETDFRVLLLHAGLENFSPEAGPKLAYSDLLALQRQVHYVALGGCDQQYETEAWAYNPGSRGLFHVKVDTAITPTFIARHVAFPCEQPAWPSPELEPLPREALERELLEEQLDRAGCSASERQQQRRVAMLLSGLLSHDDDPRRVLERVIELTAEETPARVAD